MTFTFSSSCQVEVEADDVENAKKKVQEKFEEIDFGSVDCIVDPEILIVEDKQGEVLFGS